MTGKEQRILSSYHAIGAQKIRPDDGEDQNAVENMKKSVNFDLPELRHNVDLLLDQFEEELIANDRALKYHKNRVEVLKKEEEKLSILCQHESSEINTLNEILEAVEIAFGARRRPAAVETALLAAVACHATSAE